MFGYGPYLCISTALFVLFLMWVFWGGKKPYEFVGLGPITPSSCASYNGSIYNWSNGNKEEEEEPICEREEEPICEKEDDYQGMVERIVKEAAEKRKGRQISVGEQICRATVEKYYKVPFPTKRPNWLQNPETGGNLELDCYNKDLQLAVEYNGEQHYKWPNQYPDMTYEQFIQQVRRDELKRVLCDGNGVFLITVPYTIKHGDIPSFIIANLPK